MDKATIKAGDTVRCLAGDIDRKRGAGETGKVEGFATFSRYHPQEAYVTGLGWFWVCDLEKVA